MTNKALNNSNISVEKLKTTLQDLSERLSNKGALSEIIGESLRAFKSFYQEIGDPSFSPLHLETGDNPNSELYNKNFSSIDADLKRFYATVDSVAAAQIQSFNYATVVNQELVKRSDSLASLVLDLKILSDFTRGDVLVAGDDFRTLDNVDTSIATASPKAEKMYGTGGMSLKRKENRNLVTERTQVEVFPLAPAKGKSAQVNIEPTPGNTERFYEGNYYGFIGEARPEGSQFNIKYILTPDEQIKKEKSTPLDKVFGQVPGTVEKPKSVVDFIDKLDEDTNPYADSKIGYFVELGATEEQKKAKRRLMFDGDPSTFWESEYVFPTKPLIANLLPSEINSSGSPAPRGVSVVIDYKEAERVAKQYDFEGQDLIVDFVLTFPEQVPANYVVLDPILFGATAFPEVLEISTATDDDGQFTLVDGWDLNRYAKTITPEANEFLNDVQVGQLLSPSRFEYTGKGVFPFPSRIVKKIKIRVKMDNPVPAIYERHYILLRHQIDIESEITTRTKKGAFRF